MIRQFIGTARAARAVPSSPRVTVSVASGATQVERHAIREAVHAAGAAHVTLLEKPIAAALGAGLSTRDGLGTVVVDIGAGTTEIGVVAFGSVAHKTSARVGGDAFDNAIISYMRRTHGLLIGEHTASSAQAGHRLRGVRRARNPPGHHRAQSAGRHSAHAGHFRATRSSRH